ncbi:N-acetylglucosamine kinase [Planomonospora venezuelensis]|uniref:N-acetylglucosamine kinase-like BadF-type ATPase n=1 Tax=Planomonospora venezuelensis TaxID=1999 RepID=A0A841DB34_PLAVE|nr:BadF/BadG/BcrA/BcrD ATPase family protein [Planomonospora venezuelensis]MBB5965947.1 N-acetylglucosamine kinase-like BadF-type ATPase [Planomonospora venezuelensis]
MTAVVVGVDGGGTGTRCVVATESGEVAGRGRAGGSNVLSAADPGESLRAALRDALEGVAGARVAGGVFALAGAESARERAESLVSGVWRACGLDGRVEIVPDPLAAFAGATAEPSGTVLIAGTGAMAARISGRRLTARVDGHGWLLGDEGSGVWIGRRAVQAVLALLDGRAAPTALLDAVAARVAAWETGEAGVPPGEEAATAATLTPWRVVRAVHGGISAAGPAWLGRLAPAVEAAAGDGDAAALEIIREAAGRLVSTALALGPGPEPGAPGGSGPLVFAGSLLTGPTALAAMVRTGLGDAAGTVVAARDSAAGAAALALHAVLPDALAAHRKLIV